MPRYPFKRVPHHPPYVARSEEDAALKKVADDAFELLLLLGNDTGVGVTRTLKTFVDQTVPTCRFRGPQSRYPVVLDLFRDADLDPILILVLLRNELVQAVNVACGYSNLGTYLIGFDALYIHWLSKVNLEADNVIELKSTDRSKIGKGVFKLAVTVGTAGMFHLLIGAAEFSSLARDIGWPTTESIDAGKEKLQEGAIERVIDNIHNFVHRIVTPRLSPRVRAAIGTGDVLDSQLWMVMVELLLDAIVHIQSNLKDGRLLLAIDAVDEVVSDDDVPAELDPLETRFALASLITNLRTSKVGGILCGRAPAKPWIDEICGQPHTVKDIGAISEHLVRSTFKQVGLSADVIDAILAKTGSPIIANNLSAACKALAINWPELV